MSDQPDRIPCIVIEDEILALEMMQDYIGRNRTFGSEEKSRMFSQKQEDLRFFACNNYGFFSIRHNSSDRLPIVL